MNETLTETTLAEIERKFNAADVIDDDDHAALIAALRASRARERRYETALTRIATFGNHLGYGDEALIAQAALEEANAVSKETPAMTTPSAAAEAVACPECGVPTGQACMNGIRERPYPVGWHHKSRLASALAAAEQEAARLRAAAEAVTRAWDTFDVDHFIEVAKDKPGAYTHESGPAMSDAIEKLIAALAVQPASKVHPDA